MTKKKRELTADERKLWRRVAAGVKTRKTLLPESEPGEDTRGDAPRVLRAKVAVHPAPSRARTPASPQNRENEKRVRRGKLDIGATLDLHGHTQDTARAALRRFLRAAQRRGERTVVVVTGVGRSGAGVLKRRLPEWLGETDFATLVSSYAPAHRIHGGAGAFYVFVKRGH